MVAGPAGAADATAQAQAFVRDLGAEAIKIVSNPDLASQNFERVFGQFVDRGFDVDTVGRFALGAYARSMTPAQMQEFQHLFHDYVVHTYAMRFKQYSGETFKVGTARPVADNEALVSSEIV